MDLVLIERARGGDVEAFERIVVGRIDRVYRLTLAITGNASDADDASQDAFLAVWRGLPGLRDPSRFDVWLTKIATNAARTQLRRRRRRPERLLESSDGAAPAGRSDDRVAVLEAIGRLPVEQREVVALYYLDDRPVSEIASSLHVPTGTVKSRLSTARLSLRMLLEGMDK